MTRRVLSHLSLEKNEIQNAVIQQLATAPSSPAKGQFYYDTVDDKVYVYDGSDWVDMTSAGGSGSTNLSWDAPTRTIASDTGSDATLSLADGTNAGLMSNTDYSKLSGIEASADVTDAANVESALNSATLTTATVAGNDKVLIKDTSASNVLKTVTAQEIADLHDDAVDTVNGATGTVVLDADDIDDTSTTNKFATAGQLAKVDYLTVTQAVDLDAIETRVNALDAAVVLAGTWDASGGSFPGSGSAQAGYSYIVSVAGTVNSIAFAVGDRVLAIVDNASTSTYASNWLKLDYTDQVLSVNTQTGAVVLDADDIGVSGTTNKFVTSADLTKLSNLSGTNTGDEPTASTSAEGVVELATVGEAQAKTATDRALTPASVADFARKYTGTIGNGSSTSIAVTHGLGSQYVTAQVFEVSTGAMVDCDVVLTSSTQTTFGFTVAPSTNALRVVIIG